MSAEVRAASPILQNSFLRFLPLPLLLPQSAPLSAIVGWATAFIPSILLAMLVSALIPEVQQPAFDVDGPRALALIVVFAPVLETLIMGTVLLILLRFLPPAVAVAASSLGWGIAHSMAAPVWGLVIWWPFLIFSTLFVAWRERSLLAAFAMPALVHGLHNLPSALLLAWSQSQ